MSNIRYLIKVTATAKSNNPNFAGAVIIYYYGRSQILVGVHSEGVDPPQEMEIPSYYVKEYGYTTRNTKSAERFWTSLTDDPSIPSFWTYKAETVAYDLETNSFVNNIA